MKFLINERLSEHKTKTPEGYLICLDAILARTGKQTYKKNEIFVDSDDDTEIEVDRTEDEVFSPQTLASFENKPITVEHPDEDVNVHNYKEYAVGFVRDVRRGEVNGEPVILGNLVITDEQTIQEIENGEHTDLSCGYDCDIVDEEHPCQKNIRGNHVALCEQGRAGIARIVDSVKDETLYQVVVYEHGDWAGVGKALTGETFWVKTTNKEDAIRKVRAKKPNADKYEATLVDPSFISETKINFMKNRGRFIEDGKEHRAYFTNGEILEYPKENGLKRAVKIHQEYGHKYGEPTKTFYRGDNPELHRELKKVFGDERKLTAEELIKMPAGSKVLRNGKVVTKFTNDNINSPYQWESEDGVKYTNYTLTLLEGCTKLNDAKVLEVGKKVKIKSPSSWANGEWGIIKGIDGDDYYVAIANDPHQALLFAKEELKLIDSIEDSVSYKGYKIDEHTYLHNEEKGFKYEITKNGIIVGGADSLDEAKRKIDKGLLNDSINDAIETYYFTWIDTYTKAKGYDSSFWRFKDEVKANSLNEALKKLEYIVVMRGVGTANCLVVHVSTPRTTYQFSGRLSDLLRKNFDDSVKDDKFDKATAQAYRALKFGAINSEEVIQELKRTFGLSYDDAKRAFMKAHMKYEFEDSVEDARSFKIPAGTVIKMINRRPYNSDAKLIQGTKAIRTSKDIVAEDIGSLRKQCEQLFVKAYNSYSGTDWGWSDDFNIKEFVSDSINDVEPRADESKDEFIARFMKETEGEYPDEKQRLAVAYSYWNKKDSVKDADKYRIGQQVRYHGKPTKILKIEYDPRYGYDLLIENPEWDGKNEKLKNVWVGENVDDSVKDALIDPPQDIINDFERQLKANGVIITATGKTMILGRKHYQVKYYGSGRELNDIFKKIDQYMRSKNIPMTWSIASDTENDICTAGIDLDKMYVKDSSKKMEKVQKIVKAIKKIK